MDVMLRRGLEIVSGQFSSVQLLSRVQLFATPWTATCQPSLPITNFQSVLKLTSTESAIVSGTETHMQTDCIVRVSPLTASICG